MNFLKVTIREQGITEIDFVEMNEKSLEKYYTQIPFSNAYVRKVNLTETVTLIPTNASKRELELIMNKTK